MNKIFGFFKEKITEAKEQNKEDLMTLAQAISQSEYSKDKVMGMLQNAKANYMSWNILIANEASTGLYYCQVHNRNLCLKKIKANEQLTLSAQKNKIKLQQIRRTHEQLHEMSLLNGEWANRINKKVDSLFRQQLQEKKIVVEEKNVQTELQAFPKQKPTSETQNKQDSEVG